MRKLLILAALFTSVTLHSCTKEKEGNTTNQDIVVGGSDFTDPDASYSLSDFNATHMPKDFDTWVIDDQEATADDFEGLSAAISKISADEDNTREISLVFSEMANIPNYAMLGVNYTVTDDGNEYELDVTFSPDYNMSAITSVSAPKAEKIGSYAFVKCFNLSTIDFPKATSVGHKAFLYCSSIATLTDAQFPELESIGSYSFNLCGALTSVDLPKVTTLYKGAFQLCQTLGDVSLAAAQNLHDVAFSGCSALATLSVPSATVIGGSVFTGCKSLTGITLATSAELTSVNKNAFYGVSTSAIALSTGSSNSKFIVDGNTLEIGGFSATFASIDSSL